MKIKYREYRFGNSFLIIKHNHSFALIDICMGKFSGNLETYIKNFVSYTDFENKGNSHVQNIVRSMKLKLK